jgi:uncharacterized protein (DUF2147 family)
MGVTSSFKSASNSYNFSSSACGCGSGSNSCPDKFGCPAGVCPDFVIRRHDTKPALKISVADCDGPLALDGLILEVNMWAKARLRTKLLEADTYFRLADDIGFHQIMVGDIIMMDRVRLPEQMLVTGFDEANKLVQVQRGYQATPISEYPKGNYLRIFRVMNSPAQIEMILQDETATDGTVTTDVLQESFFIYEWSPEDTCLPGCYWLEFKLLKMLGLVLYVNSGNWTGEVNVDDNGKYYTGTVFSDSSVLISYDSVNDAYVFSPQTWTGEYHLYSAEYYTGSTHDDGSVLLSRSGESIKTVSALSLDASIIPTFTDPSLTSDDFHCSLGTGVEWIRRFPVNGEGFLIKIYDSPTSE